MDYKVAALKVTCSHLKEAVETTSQKKGVSMASLGGILFQRAWVQGLLVWTSDSAGDLLLDDGTAVLLLSLSRAPSPLVPRNVCNGGRRLCYPYGRTTIAEGSQDCGSF